MLPNISPQSVVLVLGVQLPVRLTVGGQNVWTDVEELQSPLVC